MLHSEASSLARELMNDWGLGHWVFQWDRAKRRAGRCSYSRRIISLSWYYVQNNPEEDVRNTILHEIAHALAGSTVGHGPLWKLWAHRVGAKPERCYGEHVVMPKGQYQAECPSCQQTFHRHRRPRRGSMFYCLKCGPVNGKIEYMLRESVPS